MKCTLIITTFNNDKNLSRAIYSALNQTLKDIEILIIDDCSTDNTYSLVQSFIKQDNRIIYHKNEAKIGFEASKNKGLKLSQGDYVAFYNSDDWISENFVESLYNKATTQNVDITKCSVIEVFDNYSSLSKSQNSIQGSLIKQGSNLTKISSFSKDAFYYHSHKESELKNYSLLGLPLFKYIKTANSDGYATKSFYLFNIKFFKKFKNNELQQITFLGFSFAIKLKKRKNNKKIHYFSIQKSHQLLYEANNKKVWNADYINTNWAIVGESIYDLHQLNASNNLHSIYNPNRDLFLKLTNYSYLIISSKRLYKFSDDDIKTILHNNNKFLFVEDSFFRSINLFYSKNLIENKYTKPISFMLDDLGFHFSCYYPTRIELMLQNSPELTPAQRTRAISNIRYIRKNYLTKYNFKPINTNFVLPGNNKQKILVIGQKINDASITNSNVPSNIFDIILQASINENPHADILFVDHPENKHNNLPNGLSLSDMPNLYMLDNDTAITVLLEAVDKVYVCSSGVGLESIIRGKETVVFGVPLYAGWGLTDDRNELFNTENMQKRRNKKLTIEDIFYRTYIDYTVYKLPNETQPCEIEDALEYLTRTRGEYFEDIKTGKIKPTYN